jgi:hypothetical protein
VAEYERLHNVLRDDSIEPKYGWRLTRTEVVISSNERKSNIGPSPAPFIDRGVEGPAAIDPSMHQIAEHQKFFGSKPFKQGRQPINIVGCRSDGNRNSTRPEHLGLAKVEIGHNQHL